MLTSFFLWHALWVSNFCQFFSLMTEEANAADSMLRLIWLTNGIQLTLSELVAVL